MCSDSLSELLAAQFVQCGKSTTKLWLAQLQPSQLVLLDCWSELDSKSNLVYLLVIIKITGRPSFVGWVSSAPEPGSK